MSPQKDQTQSITKDSLISMIRQARQQEKQHEAAMHAAAGAAQAYEHLLSQLVKAEKQAPAAGNVADLAAGLMGDAEAKMRKEAKAKPLDAPKPLSPVVKKAKKVK